MVTFPSLLWGAPLAGSTSGRSFGEARYFWAAFGHAIFFAMVHVPCCGSSSGLSQVELDGLVTDVDCAVKKDVLALVDAQVVEAGG